MELNLIYLPKLQSQDWYLKIRELYFNYYKTYNALKTSEVPLIGISIIDKKSIFLYTDCGTVAFDMDRDPEEPGWNIIMDNFEKDMVPYVGDINEFITILQKYVPDDDSKQSQNYKLLLKNIKVSLMRNTVFLFSKTRPLHTIPKDEVIYESVLVATGDYRIGCIPMSYCEALEIDDSLYKREKTNFIAAIDYVN